MMATPGKVPLHVNAYLAVLQELALQQTGFVWTTLATMEHF
jgi:hypothetical protein